MASPFEGGKGHVGDLDLALVAGRGLEGASADRVGPNAGKIATPGVGPRISGQQAESLGQERAGFFRLAAEARRQLLDQRLEIVGNADRPELHDKRPAMKCRNAHPALMSDSPIFN